MLSSNVKRGKMPQAWSGRDENEIDLHPEVALCHPEWWVALIVLVLNDHFFKGAGILPGIVTGKLSDLAGLFLAPPLLAAIVRVRRPSSYGLCCASVVTVFAAINLSPAAASAWTDCFRFFGLPWKTWTDPTDLLALPMVWLSWKKLRPFMCSISRSPCAARLTRFAAATLGLFFCTATSPHMMRQPALKKPYLYVARDEACVLNADSGKVLRCSEIDGDYWELAIVDNGRWFYLDDDDRLVTWKHRRDTHTRDGAFADKSRKTRLIDVDERRVYLMVHGNPTECFYVADRATGRILWKKEGHRHTYRVLRIISELDLVVMNPLEFDESKDTFFSRELKPTRIRGVDAQTGKTRWVLPPEYNGWSTADIRGKLVVLTYKGEIVIVDLKTGEVGFRKKLDKVGKFVHVVADEERVYPYGWKNSSIYGYTVAISSETGDVLWRSSCADPRVSDGVVLCRYGSELFGLNAKTGSELWRFQTRLGFECGTLAAEGRAFIHCPEEVLAIDLVTGKTVWKTVFER